MNNAVKSVIGLFIGPVDLLGGLLDEDTSARVRGLLVAILCLLGGWFAKDYFSQTLKQSDIVPIIAQQRVQQRLIEGQMRKQCRQDTAAFVCERRVEERVRDIEGQVMEELRDGGSQ